MANKMKNQQQAGVKSREEYAKELTSPADQEVASEFPANAAQKALNKRQQQQQQNKQ